MRKMRHLSKTPVNRTRAATDNLQSFSVLGVQRRDFQKADIQLLYRTPKADSHFFEESHVSILVISHL